MIELYPGAERGTTRLGWLDGRHSFSFGEYLDPRRMGFRTLRVLNDDRIAPGGGFPTHPHRDMEILTWVLDGALEHKDSLGSAAVVPAGELQRMTAGRGVTHSEFNASPDDPVHLLQIWILPEEKGLEPGYEQASVADEWSLGASRDGRDGSLTIHQDAQVWLGRPGERTHPLAPERHAYVHVATGEATVQGHRLVAGDAVALGGEPEIALAGAGQVLLFDLA